MASSWSRPVLFSIPISLKCQQYPWYVGDVDSSLAAKGRQTDQFVAIGEHLGKKIQQQSSATQCEAKEP